MQNENGGYFVVLPCNVLVMQRNVLVMQCNVLIPPRNVLVMQCNVLVMQCNVLVLQCDVFISFCEYMLTNRINRRCRLVRRDLDPIRRVLIHLWKRGKGISNLDTLPITARHKTPCDTLYPTYCDTEITRQSRVCMTRFFYTVLRCLLLRTVLHTIIQ